MGESFLTVKEISSYLHIHPNTVYRWTGEGKLPYARINGLIRFRQQEIEDWERAAKSNSVDFSEIFPRLDLSLRNYDKMCLKGRHALSKRGSKRWNYGFGAIFTKTTKQGVVRWYVDYQDECGKRVQKVIKHARSRGDAVIELQARTQEVFSRRNRLRPRLKRIKFEAFKLIYLDDYSRTNKRSWKTDRSCLQSLGEFFDDFYLDEITSQHTVNS